MGGQGTGDPGSRQKGRSHDTLKKKMDYTVLKHRVDGEGRKVTIDLMIGTRTLTISNIYAPNTQRANLPGHDPVVGSSPFTIPPGRG